MGRKAAFTLCRVKLKEKYAWYVMFRDPKSGRRMTKKSVEKLREELGEQTTEPIVRREDAERVCVKALQKEALSFSSVREAVITLRDYLSDFYDGERSEYIKRRMTLEKDSLSRDYMATRCNLIHRHVTPLLPQALALRDLTLSVLEDLQYNLVKKDELSRTTINMAMQAILFALKEAQRRNIIPSSVVLSLPLLKAKPRIRGIMTDEEVRRYLSHAKKEENKRIYLSALLSLMTGMRSGELRALTPSQIKDDMIVVDRAYADRQGEKSPKGRKTRIVPCPAFLCEELRSFSHTNPYRCKETLVFWSRKNGKYVSSHYFTEIFHKCLVESKVMDAAEIERRNISFHSFRHMANTLLRGSVDEYVLRLTIGHSSEQLSDLYTHLSSKAFKSVQDAQKNNILPLLGPDGS